MSINWDVKGCSKADFREDEEFSLGHYKLEMSAAQAYVHTSGVWERNLNEKYTGR